MPETTIDEDHQIAGRDDEIRGAWQLTPIAKETDATSAKNRPHPKFWLGPPCANLAHVIGSRR